MAKHEPFIGEHLYLRQYTSNCWINDVRRPYTVISVNDKKTICVVQEAKCIFNGAQYYDTLPDDIVENKEGKTRRLRWSEKKQRWQESPADSYPYCAVFGQWDYYPYLD